MTAQRPRIALMVGSARPVRIGDQLGASIAEIVRGAADVDVEVLDLRELALPILDEPVMTGMNQYAHDHTRRGPRRSPLSTA